MRPDDITKDFRAALSWCEAEGLGLYVLADAGVGEPALSGISRGVRDETAFDSSPPPFELHLQELRVSYFDAGSSIEVATSFGRDRDVDGARARCEFMLASAVASDELPGRRVYWAPSGRAVDRLRVQLLMFRQRMSERLRGLADRFRDGPDGFGIAYAEAREGVVWGTSTVVIDGERFDAETATLGARCIVLCCRGDAPTLQIDLEGAWQGPLDVHASRDYSALLESSEHRRAGPGA